MNKLPSENIAVVQPVEAPSAKDLINSIETILEHLQLRSDSLLASLTKQSLSWNVNTPDFGTILSEKYKDPDQFFGNAVKNTATANIKENLKVSDCHFDDIPKIIANKEIIKNPKQEILSLAVLCDIILFASGEKNKESEVHFFDFLIHLGSHNHAEFKTSLANIKFGSRFDRERVLIFLEVLTALNQSHNYNKSYPKIIEKWINQDSSTFEARQSLLIFYYIALKKGEITPSEKKFLGDQGLQVLLKIKNTLFFNKHFLQQREKKLGRLLEIIVEKNQNDMHLGMLFNQEIIAILQKMKKPPQSLQESFYLKYQKPVFNLLGLNEEEIEEIRAETENFVNKIEESINLTSVLREWFKGFQDVDSIGVSPEQAVDFFRQRLPNLTARMNENSEKNENLRLGLDFCVLGRNFLKLAKSENETLITNFANDISLILLCLFVQDQKDPNKIERLIPITSLLKHYYSGRSRQISMPKSLNYNTLESVPHFIALRNELFEIMSNDTSPDLNRMIEIFNTFLVLPLPSILEMFLHSDFDFFWQAYSQKYETALKYNSELRSFFVGGMGTEVFKHSILKRYFAPAETPRIAHCSAAERRATRIKSRAKRAIEQPQFRKQPVEIEAHCQIGSGAVEVLNGGVLYKKDQNLYWILEVDGRKVKIAYDAAEREFKTTGDDEIRDEFEDKIMTLHLVSSKLEATPQKIEYKSAKKAAILDTPLEIDEAKWEEIKSNIRKRNLKTVSVKQLVKNWPEIEANVKMQDVCLCFRVGDKIVRRSMNSIIDFREFEWQDRQNSVEIFWGPKEGGEKTSWPKRTETLWVNPKEKTTSRPAEKPAPTPASAPAKAVRARAAKVVKVVETGDEDLYLEFLDENYQTEISESEVVFVFSEKNKRISVKKSGENWKVDSPIVKDAEFKKALLEVAKEKWGEWKEKEDQKKAAQKQVSINSNNLSKIKKKHRSLPKIYEKFAQTARSFSPLDLVDKNGNLIFGWRDLQDLVRFLGSNGVQIEFTNENQFKISAAKMEVVVQFNYTGRCIFVSPSVPDPSQGWIKEIFEFGVFHFLNNAKKLAENRQIILEKREVQRTLKAIENRTCRVPVYHPNGEYDRPRKLNEDETLEAETWVVIRDAHLRFSGENQSQQIDYSRVEYFLRSPRNQRYFIQRILNSFQEGNRKLGQCQPIKSKKVLEIVRKKLWENLEIELADLQNPEISAQTILDLDGGSESALPKWMGEVLVECDQNQISIMTVHEVVLSVAEVRHQAAQMKINSH